jgi:hypothetical protein
MPSVVCTTGLRENTSNVQHRQKGRLTSLSFNTYFIPPLVPQGNRRGRFLLGVFLCATKEKHQRAMPEK